MEGEVSEIEERRTDDNLIPHREELSAETRSHPVAETREKIRRIDHAENPQAYIICTSPRTGSTLLADALTSTKIAGSPDEYFDIHEHNEAYWKKKLAIADDASYLDSVVGAATTPNGVFGLKLHQHQCEALQRKLGFAYSRETGQTHNAFIAESLTERFSSIKYVWLRRRNKVAQGISYYRAERSGVWRKLKGLKGLSNPEPLRFEFGKIDRCVRAVEDMDQKWRSFFQENRLAPLVVVYEDFVKSHDRTVRAILAFLGLGNQYIALPEPRLVRQADQVSLDWEQQYREIRGRGAAASVTKAFAPIVRTPAPETLKSVSESTAALTVTKAPAVHRNVSERSPAFSSAYLICTTPRTGSTLLGDALSSTGLAGAPDEFFTRRHHADYWRRRVGARQEAEYIDKLISDTMSQNGVFGAKLHWHQTAAMHVNLVSALQSQIGDVSSRSLEELVREKFRSPRYIWLRRHNKVAQGVSYYRAYSTGVWRAVSGRNDQNNALDRELEFDFEKINRCVEAMVEFDWRWDDYFRRHRIATIPIFYEELVANYEVAVRRILKRLDLPYEEVAIAPPAIDRQSDERSQTWEERYRAMRNNQRGTGAPANCDIKDDTSAIPIANVSLKESQLRSESNSHSGLSIRDEAPLPFTAYAASRARLRLVTAPVDRDWMNAISNRFAYRCLPMLIANQAGWFILNPHRISVTWNGEKGVDALTIEYQDGARLRCGHSHFGFGILTFAIPYLFRTPRGFNLHVRGPANQPKDGIAPLEGIVETDWSEATFTMNWKMTRPDQTIVFEEGEPIAMVTPVHHGELERFRPEVRPLSENVELAKGYQAWSQSRGQFNAELRLPESTARRQGWQRHYMRGKTMSGQSAPTHQTSLKLAEFVDS
jgi:LPS sulfotransferase NodH